jgi:hypothetical protein
VLSSLVAMGAPPARAQQAPPSPPSPEEATKAACLRSYETSQVHRQRQELRAARQDLLVCASDACPGVARADCVEWLAEVNAATPTVVFEARGADGPVFDVSVKIDGAQLVTQLDGHPVEVDPGVHTFTFEHSGNPPIEQRVIIRAGEKSRSVAADWAPKAPAGAVEKIPMERPVPASVFIVGGVGAGLGLATFGVGAIWGDIKKNQIQSTNCAPFCSANDVHTVRTLYAVADVGLGVAVAAVVVSGILYFTRPERPVRSPSHGSLMISPPAMGPTGPTGARGASGAATMSGVTGVSSGSSAWVVGWRGDF